MATLDLLVRLLRWRKLILINTLIVAVLAVVISLLLPNWYSARVSILPPQEEMLTLGGLTRNLGSALGAAGQVAMGLSGRTSLPMWASPSDYLAGILRSRRLREPIVHEHDLIEVYEVENIDEALKAFSNHIKIRVGPEGIVRVSIEDKSPARAAAITGSCLSILDQIQRETRRSRAADVRGFIAERLETAQATLAQAEEALRDFQQAHGLLMPEEQAAALVETIARVEAERIMALVEREALSVQVSSEHPDVLRLDARVRALEKAKASLEGRDSRESAEAQLAELGIQGPTAIIDLQQLPALTLTYLRLFREVEIQGVLFELLTQMLEQYRIQEVRDLPTIQVLDPPAVPVEKSKPMRAVICITATLLAFFISLGSAALLERLAMLAESDPARHAQVARLLAGIGVGFLLPRK